MAEDVWRNEEVIALPGSSDPPQNSDLEAIDVKSEPPSPDDAGRIIDSDTQEDADQIIPAAKQSRRFAHSVAEQKRRDAIRKGYDDLLSIVPMCQQSTSPGAQKPSKAIILQKSIDYISFMHQQRKKHENELEKLRKEVMALKIMKANYEQIAKAHQSQPNTGQKKVSDEAKFSVFKQIMDNQFLTFNDTVAVNDFDSLSSGIFNWLEEYCKPQFFMDTVIRSLRTLSTQGAFQT